MAAILSKRVLEDIRSRNDISDVIGAYFTLQRSGSTFKALCPFHKEKTPSFHVNPQRQIFHCFGCGAGGDVFKFVMQYENVDFMAAVRMLAERAGIRLEFDEHPGARADTSNKQALFKLHTAVAHVFHLELKTSPAGAAARAYLAERSLDQTAIDQFLIGYAPLQWDFITTWGPKNGYPAELLLQAGLIVKNEKPEATNPYYDRFRGRIIFPIRDEQGRVVAFSARTMESDPGVAKYVNSPETPLFRKSNILYAMDLARRPMVETREAILCEGQIDVIRCHRAGFITAVAAQGTAFTEDHARILHRYADCAVLMFDSDAAGVNAAQRTAVILMQAGVSVRVASLPEGEDPDSFIKSKGPAAFHTVIEKAASMVEFQVRVLSKRENIRTEVGLKRVTGAVLQTIAAAPTDVQRDHLIGFASRHLGVHPDVLRHDLARLARARIRREPAPPATPDADETAQPLPAEELALAEALGATPEFAELVRTLVPPRIIAHSLCRAFIEAVLEAQASGATLAATLAERDDAKRSLTSFAARVLAAPVKTGTPGKAEYTPTDNIRQLITAIWRGELQRRRAAIEHAIHDAAPDALTQVEMDSKKSVLTGHIKLLRNWDNAVLIIPMYFTDDSGKI